MIREFTFLLALCYMEQKWYGDDSAWVGSQSERHNNQLFRPFNHAITCGYPLLFFTQIILKKFKL